jgi:hypothetical protein
MTLTRGPFNKVGGEPVPVERHITAPLVSFGDTAHDEPGILQDVEVMGEEIALHLGELGQFGDGEITESEMVGY